MTLLRVFDQNSIALSSIQCHWGTVQWPSVVCSCSRHFDCCSAALLLLFLPDSRWQQQWQQQWRHEWYWSAKFVFRNPMATEMDSGLSKQWSSRWTEIKKCVHRPIAIYARHRKRETYNVASALSLPYNRDKNLDNDWHVGFGRRNYKQLLRITVPYIRIGYKTGVSRLTMKATDMKLYLTRGNQL